MVYTMMIGRVIAQLRKASRILKQEQLLKEEKRKYWTVGSIIDELLTKSRDIVIKVVMTK